VRILADQYTNDYQRAELQGDVLVPTGTSARKWGAVQLAVQHLGHVPGRPFLFADFGCSYGLFSLLLWHHYGAMGDMVTLGRLDVPACQRVEEYTHAAVRFVRADAMDVVGTYDLTLYLSLVHHLLAHGHRPERIAETIRKQTRSAALVELPTAVDHLADKKLPGESRRLVEQLRAELCARMTLLATLTLTYSQTLVRDCLVLQC